jgi:hypothetical protein
MTSKPIAQLNFDAKFHSAGRDDLTHSLRDGVAGDQCPNEDAHDSGAPSGYLVKRATICVI